MYKTDDKIVLSATDVVGSLACAHLTSSNLAAMGEGKQRDFRQGALTKVQIRRGIEHERDYLQSLYEQTLDVVEISDGDTSLDGLRNAEQATRAAIEAGADIIYQGTFLDERGDVRWRGHADFLRRVDIGDGSNIYEPEDTKLAHQVKTSMVLQLCNYAEQLERLQGVPPEQVHVVLGTKESVPLRLADFSAYYRAAKARLVEQARLGSPVTYPLPVAHCGVCDYRSRCEQRWADDDHLSLVAGMTRSQTARLEREGITTLAGLATSDPELRIRRMAEVSLRRLQNQARLQLQARTRSNEPPPYELAEPQGADTGLEMLPLPSAGDLFFDIESDPYAAEGGLEYLFGIGWVEAAKFRFKAFWAHSPQEEMVAFEALVDFIVERRRVHPDLHVYHYAPYERSALERLMGRHGTRENEVDDLFRGKVLVDLYRAVRQAMTIGVASYSIKKLEPLYMESRDADILDAGSSIVEYERWLEVGDQSILDSLEEYNRDDCRSTWLLRDWLEARRVEASVEFGRELERPLAGAQPVESEDDSDETSDVIAQLLASVEEPFTGDDDAEAATWLLAQLFRWHQREQKPQWWAYFNRLDCDEDELFDDTEALAGLRYVGVVETIKRSQVHRYAFDPDQEHKLSTGDQPLDPASERMKLETGCAAPMPGTVVAMDSVAGTIDLKRGNTSEAAHPRSLIPGKPLNDSAHRAALLELGRDVVEHGIDDNGPGRAARDLLLRRHPRLDGYGPGAPLVDGVPTIDDLTNIAARLDQSCLGVQGPPGTGKTYTAARSIVALVKKGKRVGITANSHAVITNLLDEVMEAAVEAGNPVRAIQKSDSRGSERADVEIINDNQKIELALATHEVDVVAGTSWLFAREGMIETLDYLVVDEAGQLSLANVLAISRSAQNLILVGDPQQLAQPSKGSHPPGADASALEHLLDGEHTIPADRGLFLGRSYRMHPEVCEFVSEISYDNRLHSIDECELQRVHGDDALSGSGLRWAPVEHKDNRTRSDEEAERVRELVDELVGRSWTDRHGVAAELTLEDLLVVAPYNAQVNALAQALPDGARVGTVDKFQGREGAVAIVSFAASDAESVPRGMEFLFSQNRLNVAVSRAQAMSIVVASPQLLAAQCSTVEQMHLVNGLCRYVEMATPIPMSKP